MSIRTEKVASLIKRTIAGYVSELARDNSAGLVTITSVRLTKDLHIANVYVSIFDQKNGPDYFMSILSEHSSSIRSLVGRNVRLRYTPELRFFLDDTLDQIEHIQKLLNSTDSNSSVEKT